MDTLRQQLKVVAGVSPNTAWLTDCTNALQEHTQHQSYQPELVTQNEQQRLASSVLEQILHEDLRSVVRGLPVDNSNIMDDIVTNSSHTRNSTFTISHDAEQLRECILQSKSSLFQYKSILPESFRLLIQIEEYIDVGSSFEKRMEMVTNDPSLPLRYNSDMSSRCLKFCYSDGYPISDNNTTPTLRNERSDESTNGRNSRNNSTVQGYNNDGNNNNINNNNEWPTMVAMEVSPLAGLGMPLYPLLAGIKVLLHGRIIIRHGVAGWHDGNATVLGGFVPRLVDIQFRELRNAKERCGHGVDPTVRALIWNNHPNHVNSEADIILQDEAEHNSHDFVSMEPQQQQSHQRHTQQQQQRAGHESTQQTPFVSDLSLAVMNRESNVEHSEQFPHSGRNHPQLVSVDTSTSIQSIQPVLHQISTLADPSNRFQSTSVIRSTLQGLSVSSNGNPYLRASFTARSNNALNRITSNNAKSQNQPHHSTDTTTASSIMDLDSDTVPFSIYQQHSHTPDTTGVITSTMSTNEVAPTSSLHQQEQQRHQYLPPLPPSMTETLHTGEGLEVGSRSTSAMTMTTQTMHLNHSTVTSSRNSQTATRISFRQLYELLLRAVESEVIYKHSFGQIYIVDRMRQFGSKLYFNIEKNKKKQVGLKNKADKYEYVMTGRFQGEEMDNTLLTCKVSSDIMEPYFSLTPSDMRKLNKENRIQAENLVKDGGQKLNTTLLQFGSYEVTLLLSAEEFFGSSTKNETTDTTTITTTTNETCTTKKLDGNEPIVHLLKRI